MATRSQISFSFSDDDNPVTIYKHWDGYPEAMIPILTIAYSLMDNDKDTKKFDLDLFQRKLNYFSYKPEEREDFGISGSYHGDLEYIYHFVFNGDDFVNPTIQVWEYNWNASETRMWKANVNKNYREHNFRLVGEYNADVDGKKLMKAQEKIS